MTLDEYLKKQPFSGTTFAKMLGTSKQVLSLWRVGHTIPGRAYMAKIIQHTKGSVMPNDFYGV